MKSARSPRVKPSTKAPTGIAGFDEITDGGLPRGRTTLLVGGPGSGKTLLALQFMMHDTQDCEEPDSSVVGTLSQTQTMLQALRLDVPAA